MAIAETGGEVFVDFTNEEVLTMVGILGLEAPPGVGVESLEELAIAGDVTRLRDAAIASLEARGIVTRQDDSLVVADAVAQILAALSNPGAMVAAASETDGMMETRFFAAMPEIAIEHRGLSISLHRFTPFATRDLMARMLQFVDLRPYAPDVPLQFKIDESELQSVVDHLERQDRAAAIDVLTEGGVGEKTAEAFVTGLTMKRSSASVTILHRPTEEAIEGGALSWIDAGMSGLWVTDIDDAEEEQLDVRLMDARSLVSELLSYLPEAFGDHGVVF